MAKPKIIRGCRTKDVSKNAIVYMTVLSKADHDILATWEEWFIEKDVPFIISQIDGRLCMIRDFEVLTCEQLQKLGWNIKESRI